jgi:hypothetical protein
MRRQTLIRSRREGWTVIASERGDVHEAQSLFGHTA